MDDTEKFEKYMKKKIRLTGNMALIAELHSFKYLPIKVMRFITYNLIYQFSKNLVDNRKVFLNNAIEEEYLEALLKLFDLSGALISKREESNNKPENVAIWNNLLKELDNAYKTKNFDDARLSKVVSEEQKKEINCMRLAMSFLENCMGYDISERMKSLIANLVDKKKFRLERYRLQRQGTIEVAGSCRARTKKATRARPNRQKRR